MNFPEPTPPIEDTAEHVGSIYWIPGKGDIVVCWSKGWLPSILRNGHTKDLVDWAQRLGKHIEREFKGKSQ